MHLPRMSVKLVFQLRQHRSPFLCHREGSHCDRFYDLHDVHEIGHLAVESVSRDTASQSLQHKAERDSCGESLRDVLRQSRPERDPLRRTVEEAYLRASVK